MPHRMGRTGETRRIHQHDDRTVIHMDGHSHGRSLTWTVTHMDGHSTARTSWSIDPALDVDSRRHVGNIIDGETNLSRGRHRALIRSYVAATPHGMATFSDTSPQTGLPGTKALGDGESACRRDSAMCV